MAREPRWLEAARDAAEDQDLRLPWARQAAPAVKPGTPQAGSSEDGNSDPDTCR